MTYDDDADEIRKMLTERLEGVLDDLAPGWVNYHGKGYPIPKSQKDLGSFQVNLTGSKRGTWYRFSQDIGGGSVEMVSYLLSGSRKDDYRTAFTWARRFLGLSHDQESDADREGRNRRNATARAEAEQRRTAEMERERLKKALRMSTAAEIWQECQPIAGTQAEAYLTGRGIPPVSIWPWNPINFLGFHPALDYELDRDVGLMPALVARVVDFAGDTVAVWQIYMDRQRPVRAPVEIAKVGRGPAAGGAVRLGGDGARVGANEGVESALSTWVLHGYRFPVWSLLSTSGMAGFEPPLCVERLDIFPDGDYARFDPQGRLQPPPGIVAAQSLAKRLRPTGIKVVVNEPALNGDNNDFLKAWNERERA